MPEEVPIHQEIADLERQLREKREQLSAQKESGAITEVPHEKETLREVVGEKIAAGSTPSALPYVAPTPLPPPTVATPPTELTKEMKAQAQELVNIAFTHSIDQAIQRARATNNGALIDAFHDLLVDELYDYLVERGKLKQI